MEQSRRRTQRGVVVADRMNKTVVVKVEGTERHPQYGKVVKRFNKFYAHDEKEQAKVGDSVTIMETRPISKLKRWRVTEVTASA